MTTAESMKLMDDLQNRVSNLEGILNQLDLTVRELCRRVISDGEARYASKCDLADHYGYHDNYAMTPNASVLCKEKLEGVTTDMRVDMLMATVNHLQNVVNKILREMAQP